MNRRKQIEFGQFAFARKIDMLIKERRGEVQQCKMPFPIGQITPA